MARKLENSGKADGSKSSKKYLNRREYIKAGAAAAAIVAGSGTALSDSTSEDGTVGAYSTGFGEYDA